MTDQLDPVRAALALSRNYAAERIQEVLKHLRAFEELAVGQLSFDSAVFDSISDELAKVAFPSETMFTVISAPTDGVALANKPIQDAIYNATGPLYLPAGRYLIDADSPIRLKNGLQLFMHPDAILVVVANDSPRYYVFLGERVEDVLLQGGQIIGDRLKHRYIDTGDSTRTHEWGMGVGLRSCKRVTLRNVKVRECTGDGFSISGEDLYVIDCDALYNRRQGMSIYTGRHIRVIRGEYAFTGNMSVGGVTNPGTKPMAGIDMEPDVGNLVDVKFIDVNCHDNGTTDLLGWSRDEDPNRTDEINILDVEVVGGSYVGAPNGIQGKGLGGLVEIAVRGANLSNHKGAAFFAEAGAVITVGDATRDGRNFINTVDAKVGDLSGIVTRYDMQTRPHPTGARPTGVIKAGLNNYR